MSRGKNQWAGLLAAAALAMLATRAEAQLPFYTPSSAELSGPPGSLIRSEPMLGAPLGAQAYRILYRSTGLRGEPIAVSGVAIAPLRPAPAGGRAVVAWAHPTSGVVPHCAPSLALTFFLQVPGLREMAHEGIAVVATDYPGLGTAGPHPYLVGTSEGRAVIDSVRALRGVPNANPGNRFAVWGHSQGGHAAIYAGLLTAAYAPELKLVGIAAAAPATELATLLSDDFATPGGKSLTAMTLWSWNKVFGADLATVVKPAAIPVMDALARVCIESLIDIDVRRFTEAPLERAFLSVKDITKVEPWRSIMDRNTPSVLPKNVPVFLAQGQTDNVVLPVVTRDYMRRLCRNGNAVLMEMYPGGHGFIAHKSANSTVAWLKDRFQGHRPPKNCK